MCTCSRVYRVLNVVILYLMEVLENKITVLKSHYCQCMPHLTKGQQETGLAHAQTLISQCTLAI
jgi:hypothetical protein